ncbi:MAG: L-aspartate oxidase [Candidatus Marinimicrobia bacterium]|nr:L-aspartate oxidase [Candidatus Neomarinimicrobiota bacterium]MBL7066473.1 L-aspartate oxidase [Candidatus Neomarinimicrobiota bacterium]
MKSSDRIIKTDVLVIGAGLAGCSAAYAAAQQGLSVTLITSENEFTESSSFYAQGGIIYKATDDSEAGFIEDFQRTGVDIVNEDAVRQIYRYGTEFIDEILCKKLCVPFNRSEDNSLNLIREGSHSKARIAFVKDHTGQSIQEVFYQKIKDVDNINIITEATSVDLITLAHHSLNPLHIYEPSTCVGAYVLFQKENRVYTFLAKQTILATGGLGSLYLHTSNPSHVRGDGYALAYRAGARIMNMEYVQFHPTTLFSTNEERFLISEALRGEGAVLRNKSGEDFMKRYHEMGSLAPRDVVSRSINVEMNETGSQYVYLDITHRNSEWIKQRFPKIYQKCLEVKVDITSEGIPVVPAAHYECGGVATDMKANTTIRYLKAVGEVACTGLHGANRLASSSLLECLVFGTIAGRDAAEQIRTRKVIMPSVADWKQETETIDPDLIRQDRSTIRQTMWNYVGIIRTKKKLERAFGILWQLNEDIQKFYAHSELSDDLIGLRNAATTSLLVLHAAKLNKGGRGCHYRTD